MVSNPSSGCCKALKYVGPHLVYQMFPMYAVSAAIAYSAMIQIKQVYAIVTKLSSKSI